MSFLLVLEGDEGRDDARFAALSRYEASLARGGVLRAAARLHDSTTAFRLGLALGKLTVQDGPFADARPSVRAVYSLDVEREEEAHAWAQQLPVAEREAVGVCEAASAYPNEGSVRFLLTFQGANVAPAAWASFVGAMTEAGVLVAAANGAPNGTGVRFCVVRVGARRDVFKWAWRGLKMHGEGTCRVDSVKDCRMIGPASPEDTQPCDFCSCSRPTRHPKPAR